MRASTLLIMMSMATGLTACGVPEIEFPVFVGGTVIGLEGAGLVLQNNGKDDLSVGANGSFTFPTRLASGVAYDVRVLAQPSLPTQTCIVTAGSGRTGFPAETVTSGSAAVTRVVVTCGTDEFKVGGAISGLSGSVVVQNLGGQQATLIGNGNFTFSSPIPSGSLYSVTVVAQPAFPSQTCVVMAGDGVVTNSDVTTIDIECATNDFAVGGTLVGLVGSGLVLQNMGAGDLVLTTNGSFTFSAPTESGDDYFVAVVGQPVNPTQLCTVGDGVGTIADQDVLDVQVTCVTSSFAVGGSVVGLAGTGLQLQNNGGDLMLATSGTFTFATPVDSGEGYSVAVLAQPVNPTQYCSVENAAGTISNHAVSDVTVSCVTSAFSVGGVVTGSTGSGLTLQNNGADDLLLSANGSFAFSTPVASGANYDVTILTQGSDPALVCGVSGGSGIVTDGPVTSVVVECVPAFSIGGTVAGLAGNESVEIRNNQGAPLIVSANGSFAFPLRLASGSAYEVTISGPSTPPYSLCTIANEAGIANADVVDVEITCGASACGTTFVEETLARGLPAAAGGSGVVWFDLDGDEDQDLFVRSVGLFVNDGTGHFSDEASARGVSELGAGNHSPTAVGDFDSDGDVDLFVGENSRFDGKLNHLYRNDGSGFFTDVSAAAGLAFPNNTSRAAVFIDHDVDGDVDLLYASEFGSYGMFRNDGMLPFGNDAADFSHHLQGDSAAWADYDEDGDLDLFMATGSYTFRNRLFQNNGQAWIDVAPAAGAEGPETGSGVPSRWGGATWVDLDGDGDLDLHLIRDGEVNDFVYDNQDDGTFVERLASAIGLGDGSGVMTSATWADFDRDGDLDALIPAAGLYANDGAGRFTRLSTSIGPGETAAWADVDADGLLDVYVAGNFPYAGRFYRAVSATTGCVPLKSMHVRAITDSDGAAADSDRADDRDALGARIDVALNGNGDFSGSGGPVTSYLIGSAQTGGNGQTQLGPLIGCRARDTVDLRITFLDGDVVTLLNAPVIPYLSVLDP